MTSRRMLLLATGLLVSLLPALLFAGETWRTITSSWWLSRIAASENRIWAASEGGLYSINPNTLELEFMNRDQGLWENNISTVAVEPLTGIVWIGYADAVIGRYVPEERRFLREVNDLNADQSVFTVYDIVFHGETAFVATNIGVSRLEPIEGDELRVVAETYDRFGNWPTDTPIKRVYVGTDRIFVGSDLGIAIANLDDNLISPSVWVNYDWGDEIEVPNSYEDRRITFLTEAEGTVYAGLQADSTSDTGALLHRGYAIFRFNGTDFERFGHSDRAYAMAAGGDGNVYVAGWDGIAKFNDDGTDWDYFLPDEMLPYDLVWAFDALWGVYGTTRGYIGGVFRYDGDGTVEYFFPDTPGGNQIIAVQVTPSGDLCVTADRQDPAVENSHFYGVYIQHRGLWYNFNAFNTIDSFYGYTPFALGYDTRGGIWVGSRGSGLLHIIDDPTDKDFPFQYTYFNADDSTGARLAGYLLDENPRRSNPSFVLVTGFATDPDGGVWMTNAIADNDEPLIHVPDSWYDNPGEEWQNFGPEEGFSTINIRLVVRDDSSRLWISSFEDNRTPNYPLILYRPDAPAGTQSADRFRSFNAEGFTMVSDMLIDGDGMLWLGTRSGLFFTDSRQKFDSTFVFNQMDGYLGFEVTALAADPAGNLWVGTRDGISVLGDDRFTWIAHYTTREGQYPSPLIDDDITSLAFDDRTGELFIGTNTGLSVLETPYRSVDPGTVGILVRPQPFLVSPDLNARAKFETQLLFAEEENDPYMQRGDAKAKIFTPSGRLVRELDLTGVAFEWDGRRSNGELVDSGVYLIVISDGKGNTETGKIAVVRR